MKNVIAIYQRDLKSIGRNPVALLIIGGLCLLPSLYAWINIFACWDPYGNTSTIPVAVVNQDQGTVYLGKAINMGNSIVEKLKTNKQIGWKFVAEREADLGVVDGTYFAVIVIPGDFSAGFAGVLSNSTKKPEIIYKVDTKDNPVATKITETAKNSLVDQIASSFIAAVNETLFVEFNKVGQNAAANKDKLLAWKDEIIQVNRAMDLILSVLQDINGRSANLSSLLLELQATMPGVENQLSTAGQVNENTGDLLKTTQQTLNQSLTNIGTNLNTAQASVLRVQALLSAINSSLTPAAQVNSNLDQVKMILNALNDQLGINIKYLQQLNNSWPNAQVAKLIASLQSIQSSLADEVSKIAALQKQLDSAQTVNQTLLEQINNAAANLNLQIVNAAKLYNSSARNSLNGIGNSLSTAIKDGADLISASQGLQNQISGLMSTALAGSRLSAQVSGDLRNRLLEYKDIIARLSAQLQMISNNDLAQIITVLQSNPELMGSYMSSPFNLLEEPIYVVPNYGSAMAPVYSVLALWVGTLILTSLLKTEVPGFKGSANYTLRERHFGKMLTFITLALIQGLIVVLGDKLLLGVYAVNTPLLFAAALLSSLTFAVITYTLVSLLGNFGKALAIIYMIMQLAGSGGTYPIEVDPLILRLLQPTFPFTYAISAMREAIAGPLISKVLLDFSMLLFLAAVFVLAGYFLKKPLYERVHRFETNFELSGLGE
ncbi:YhgE/Pip domain-containing protein [Desulfosporosinus sp. PR]|uniref:YhgE/Pip domain-containing protein n=1 Tax=Candidatus Desulfosporosinus nitrosoreducens TaxID=3401928 RepID=UPI0027FD8F49|nr:YhgE/Pip domain-containing protein [Desulfosporosinus sp. PR]MDQ7093640.1 YhgE/Pip domain-containing protein [Desulfosporosinus sp. PR]